MKKPLFRSIHTRIMTATTLLIVAIVGAVVLLWVKEVNYVYRQQKRKQAQQMVVALANAWVNALVEESWSQIRLNVNLLFSRNEELVYIFVSDVRRDNQIVAALPEEFTEQYIPDAIPLSQTEASLNLSGGAEIFETVILRDLKFPPGEVRAERGEQIMEVAYDVRNSQGEKIGTLRLGVSLREVNEAVIEGVIKALAVGGLGLTCGLVGAYILAKQLSYPIQRLQVSAAKIAAGDLEHRAEVPLRDEIGQLATAFNEMAWALQLSFNKQQRTLESFARFVPDKFLTVIASEGIENIQVGVASTRTMTILFADIRGYTSMSEQMSPLETFALLNDYLACMGAVIEKSGGFIDKYIGDAIMALFDEVNTDCALDAALAMQSALRKFNEARIRQALPNLEIGIGIHQGDVVMGTVGFASRIESTVIGDAVNVASRVENLTRKYHCDVLVTESVLVALAHPQAFQLHLVDDSVKVKGKEEPLAIYQVLLPDEKNS
ncbi:MAG: adenylate/guanylate cyclase domain-containing protein [Oscillatoria sp. PMC 1050.18]|nr:adenylate/guanylate cyclase domain-containing protein [Oscillatoria sp. PMC 1050.18]